MVCGDLHHGRDPLGTLNDYLDAEPHDAVILTFNPALLSTVRQRLRVPVRSLPPTFFRYPTALPSFRPRNVLLHVGSLGPHHSLRRELVATLLSTARVPFRHVTTRSPREAARLYAQYALVLNVPLSRSQPPLL